MSLLKDNQIVIGTIVHWGNNANTNPVNLSALSKLHMDSNIDSLDGFDTCPFECSNDCSDCSDCRDCRDCNRD